MTGLQKLVEALNPSNRDEGIDSVYYRAMNTTRGVLVVNKGQSHEIVEECLKADFPVALRFTEDTVGVPRIETPSESHVGEDAISSFLSEVSPARPI